ncbi:MAG: methyltransferase domain-containing protein [Candidatus Thiodiazotropha sp.]
MSDCLVTFIEEASRLPSPRVLELGTKRSRRNRSTLHKAWVPHAGEYLGTDFQSGDDVDIVGDLHSLSKLTGEARFDIVISCSTLEHVQYPWLAVEEISRMLSLNGLVAVQTHHAFPLHAYPQDYWRYTTEALSTLFCVRAGFQVLGTSYDFKSHLFSWRRPWMIRHTCYLNSYLVARKIADIPGNFNWRDCLESAHEF